jgi:hypothetical protein
MDLSLVVKIELPQVRYSGRKATVEALGYSVNACP